MFLDTILQMSHDFFQAFLLEFFKRQALLNLQPDSVDKLIRAEVSYHVYQCLVTIATAIFHFLEVNSISALKI